MADLFSFWTGPITWMERLCVASARRVGHTLTVFSYDPAPLREAGLGVSVADARDVYICDDGLSDLRQSRPDYFSDHFRLEGMARGLGTWVDLDVVFLTPLPDTPYLFGWENDEVIGSAVLRIPAGSDLLDSYLAYCRQRPIRPAPPWWPATRRIVHTLKYHSNKWRGRKPARLLYGPVALTHFVREHGLLEMAVPPEVIYPVSRAQLFYDPVDRVGGLLTPRTAVVHLWHRYFVEYHGMADPPPTSWIGKKCREYGLI